MQNRLQLFKEALPEFKNLYESSSVKPQITYYVGKDELFKMYTNILKRKKLKHYDIMAAEGEWLEINPHFFKKFKQDRATAGITTRMILEYSEVALQRQQEAQKTLSHVKILPPALSAPFHGGCYIFSESVIFVAYRKEHIAVEIVSPEIASVVQTMFSFMWKTISG